MPSCLDIAQMSKAVVLAKNLESKAGNKMATTPLGTRDASGSKVDGLGYTAGTGIVFKDFQLDLAYIHATTDEYNTTYNDVIKETTVQRILLSAIYRF